METIQIYDIDTRVRVRKGYNEKAQRKEKKVDTTDGGKR